MGGKDAWNLMTIIDFCTQKSVVNRTDEELAVMSIHMKNFSEITMTCGFIDIHTEFVDLYTQIQISL